MLIINSDGDLLRKVMDVDAWRHAVSISVSDALEAGRRLQEQAEAKERSEARKTIIDELLKDL